MTETDLFKRFLPRFIAIARDRIRRASEHLPADDATKAQAIARETHALAGESCAMNLPAVGDLALAAESAAKHCAAQCDESATRECSETLAALRIAVEELAPE